MYWFVEANVSEKRAVSIIGAEVVITEVGDSKLHRNSDIYQPVHAAT
jgi:hypothetical protein